ncbi:MAG: bifunctional nuclease family protein [candidate division WOR-3 bacterium]
MKNLIELEVKSVVMISTTEGIPQAFAVVLKEKGGSRLLPIYIGGFEANAIQMAKDGERFERPLTHNLIVSIIETLGARVERVVINDLMDNTFFARIILSKDDRTYSIDARPSDSIAIALLTNAPIYVSAHVLEEAGEYSADWDEEGQGDWE